MVDEDLERPEIDFLILADRAEGINGKLYMMGGGWQEIRVRDLSQPVSISLAVGVLIPWNATNEDHALRIVLEHEDGTQIPPEIPATLNVGRPPGAVRGQSFRAIIAVNGAWKFPQSDMYRFVATIDNEPPKRAVFRVLPATITARIEPPEAGA